MMKKSQKITSLILSAAMAVTAFSFAACAPEPEPEPEPPAHEHTYSTTLSSDDYEHWYAATCEHTDLKKDVEEHDTDGENETCSVCGHAHVHLFDEDYIYTEFTHWRMALCDHTELVEDEGRHDKNGTGGTCSVCGYEPHAHTYNETEWSKNSVYHYHAATCEHSATLAKDIAEHTYGEDGKTCTECEYVHEHQFSTSYWAVSSTKHWYAASCQHVDEKAEEAEHTFDGTTGRCTVCNYIPVVETATATNKHTHTYSYEYGLNNHWEKLTCGDKSNCKSCDKELNPEAPKVKNIAPHTYGADGVNCTVCKFNNTWSYDAACILCEECGGCIKTFCGHEGEENHKKCGDHGAETKSYTLEAEEGEVFTGSNNAGSILDYTNGKRDCIEVEYSNVKFTVTANKACTVTLRIRMGRRDSGASFSTLGTVYVNGEEQATNAIMAQPSSSDSKCSFGWITFGCIKLDAGENVIGIYQLNGETMFHMDKAELLTESDVVITHQTIDNRWFYKVSSWTPIYQDPKED